MLLRFFFFFFFFFSFFSVWDLEMIRAFTNQTLHIILHLIIEAFISINITVL